MDSPQTFVTLKVAVAEWMNREDMVDVMPVVVELAEGELRSVLPPICPSLPSIGPHLATNWLLESRPDVYMAAVLAEAYCWCSAPEQAAFWRGRMVAKIYGHDRALAVAKLGLWVRLSIWWRNFWKRAGTNGQGTN